MRGFGLNRHRSIKYNSAESFQGMYTIARVVSTFREDTSIPYGAINFQVDNGTVDGISNYALPYFQSYKSVPLIDEAVVILIGPSPNARIPQAYYLPAFNLWNHPQHGGKGPNDTPPRLGTGFNEQGDVNPMVPFPGDILFEGRRGQSIRFSESFNQASINTPWKSFDKDGNAISKQPIISIVNGQIQTSQGDYFVTEDINKDPASIYLTQNNSIGLHVAYKWVRKDENDQRLSSYMRGSEPTEGGTYQGAQIMLNSGRIYINSNKEHILISSADTVGVLGRRVNIDGDKTIALEAPLITFTGKALDPTHQRSAVRGEDLVLELEGLYNHIADLSSMLTTVLTTLNFPPTEAAALINYIYKDGPLKPRLNKMLSNRVKLS